jgi:hypothetical protein
LRLMASACVGCISPGSCGGAACIDHPHGQRLHASTQLRPCLTETGPVRTGRLGVLTIHQAVVGLTEPFNGGGIALASIAFGIEHREMHGSAAADGGSGPLSRAAMSRERHRAHTVWPGDNPP